MENPLPYYFMYYYILMGHLFSNNNICDELTDQNHIILFIII